MKEISIFIQADDTITANFAGVQQEAGTILLQNVILSPDFKEAMADELRQPFSPGLTYRLSQLADFFLYQMNPFYEFTNAVVQVPGEASENLTEYLLPSQSAVYGNDILVTDGDGTPATNDGTSMGTIAAAGNGTIVKTFTVLNSGQGTLLMDNPVLGGTNADQFSVSALAQNALQPNQIATFQVTFAPTSSGTKTATISISNNDPGSNKDPYNFSISGVAT